MRIQNSLIPITVVIPVKNEEKNLGRCLSLLDRFSEVVVIDSSSTDRTPLIAEKAGARYVNFSWDGKYPKKRNWFLLNHKVANDWVLFLDADEFMTAEACDEVSKAIELEGINGYWLSYSNWFLGSRLRFGVPQRKLALFRCGSGLYEKIDEDSWSQLDMEIHEHPIIQGQVGKIRARIDHNDDRGILKFIDRHRDYAVWEAQRAKKLKSDPTAWNGLTARQRFKYRNISRWWYPLFYFTMQYFAKFGLFDGSIGLQYAFHKFWYFNTIRLIMSDNGRPDGQESKARTPDR